MSVKFLNFPNNRLRDVLFDNYIVPAACWLLGRNEDDYLLPKVAGSCWECSLATEFLINLRGASPCDAVLKERIDRNIGSTMKWLYSKAHYEDSNSKSCSWEGTYWDTAVCARALFRSIVNVPEAFTTLELQQARITVERACHWLTARIALWTSETHYVVTAADLAQTLITLLEVARYDDSILYSIASTHIQAEAFRPLHEAAALLVTSPDVLEQDDRQKGGCTEYRWMDIINSSEVIDALSDYRLFIDDNKLWSSVSPTMSVYLINQRIYGGVTYIERHQHQGQWGGVADTGITLWCYLRTVDRSPRLQHHDLTVFKAVRWMCDRNQSLADGSFLHTTYMTVFYALALWEAYSTWPLAERRMIEVYDVAAWLSPDQAHSEKAKRLTLELNNEVAFRTCENLMNVSAQRFGSSICVFVLTVLVVLSSSLLVTSGILKPDFVVTDPTLFWSVVGICVTLSSVAGPLSFSVSSEWFKTRTNNRIANESSIVFSDH